MVDERIPKPGPPGQPSLSTRVTEVEDALKRLLDQQREQQQELSGWIEALIATISELTGQLKELVEGKDGSSGLSVKFYSIARDLHRVASDVEAIRVFLERNQSVLPAEPEPEPPLSDLTPIERLQAEAVRVATTMDPPSVFAIARQLRSTTGLDAYNYSDDQIEQAAEAALAPGSKGALDVDQVKSNIQLLARLLDTERKTGEEILDRLEHVPGRQELNEAEFVELVQQALNNSQGD